MGPSSMRLPSVLASLASIVGLCLPSFVSDTGLRGCWAEFGVLMVFACMSLVRPTLVLMVVQVLAALWIGLSASPIPQVFGFLIALFSLLGVMIEARRRWFARS
jgi:hypothetical protein